MALSKILPASQEQFAGARNLIINGAMQVAQRGTSSTSGGYGCVDRFRIAEESDQLVFTQSQETDSPEGFSNSFKINIDTAETTLDSDDNYVVQTRLEGQNLQHLKKGTSNAESLTMSFWVKSSTTGTYIVELQDRDNTRHICQSYTISSANTWEYKTLTFAGDTTGTLNNDANESFRFFWWLAAGPDFTSGTLSTSWASTTGANRAVGQVNLMDTTNNNWYITGIQLEVGETASDFEHRSYGDELARCQRYYFKSGSNYFQAGQSYAGNSGDGMRVPYNWPVTMRANPASSISGGNDGSSAATIEIISDSIHSAIINLRSTDSNTSVWWQAATITADAEL